MADPREVASRLVARHPFTATWREHLRRHPVAPGQSVLFQPSVVSAQAGEGVSPASAALSLDVIRRWMERQRNLRRMYLVVREGSAVRAGVATLGFVPILDDPVTLGGVPYRSMVLDFGPSCVDGWFADQGARLLLEADSPLDRERRELVLGDAHIALTPLECDLLACLLARDGRAISREELLREVWGYAWTAGAGNVVEVAVSALRRKLGNRAGALETVRGVGYRLAPLS